MSGTYLTPEKTSGRKLWWIGLFAFCTMLMLGIQQELSGMDLGRIKPAGETAAHYYMLLLCAAMLLTYFIPFVFFMNYTCRKMAVSRKLAIIGFFSGWFIPGWIAGDLNDAAGSLIKHLTSGNFNKAWGDSIEAPIVEELLKALVVLWVLLQFGKQNRSQYLMVGMSVGMGFQLGEDLSYIENQLSGGHHALVTAIPFTFIDRISDSLGSHWCYTGLVAAGIFLLFIEKKRTSGILLILDAFLSHGLRDSGVLSGILYDGLLDAMILVPMFYVYVKTLEKCKPERKTEITSEAHPEQKERL